MLKLVTVGAPESTRRNSGSFCAVLPWIWRLQLRRHWLVSLCVLLPASIWNWDLESLPRVSGSLRSRVRLKSMNRILVLDVSEVSVAASMTYYVLVVVVTRCPCEYLLLMKKRPAIIRLGNSLAAISKPEYSHSEYVDGYRRHLHHKWNRLVALYISACLWRILSQISPCTLFDVRSSIPSRETR